MVLPGDQAGIYVIGMVLFIVIIVRFVNHQDVPMADKISIRQCQQVEAMAKAATVVVVVIAAVVVIATTTVVEHTIDFSIKPQHLNRLLQ